MSKISKTTRVRRDIEALLDVAYRLASDNGMTLTLGANTWDGIKRYGSKRRKLILRNAEGKLIQDWQFDGNDRLAGNPVDAKSAAAR